MKSSSKYPLIAEAKTGGCLVQVVGKKLLKLTEIDRFYYLITLQFLFAKFICKPFDMEH